MFFTVMQVLLSFVVELLIMRAMCLVLDMRSNVLYVIAHTFCFILSYYLLVTNAPFHMRILIINIITNFALPIVLSRGRISSRVTRMMLVNLGSVVTEATGSLLYSISHVGEVVQQSRRLTADPGSICLIYCALIPVTALTQEIIVAFFRKRDQDPDGSIELSGMAMMLLSFPELSFILLRSEGVIGERHDIYLASLLYAIVSLVVELGLIYVARRDAQIARRAADQAAALRQERHVRGQVVEAARRASGMGRLRHDLANQVGVVESLASQGRYAEADRYLAALQAQAQALAQSIEGAAPDRRLP